MFESEERNNYDVSANSGSLAAVYLHQTICLELLLEHSNRMPANQLIVLFFKYLLAVLYNAIGQKLVLVECRATQSGVFWA